MSRALLVCALAVSLLPAARAADEPKDLLAKAIKAHGGEEHLTKTRAAQIKTKGKIDLPGVGEVDFTQESSHMFPDKFRDTLEFKVMGQDVSVFTLINGDKVTLEVNGKAIDAADKLKEAVKGTGQVFEVSRLVPLKDKKYELSTIGEDKVEGKPAVGVRVSTKGQKDVNVYFYKETGLIAKIEHRTTDQATGKEINEERILVEYAKNKDGIQTPKKVVIKHDGKQFIEAEVLELNLLEKLDDSEFKK
ncbi:hypothetical protein [Frigoriglobus tundricola]|uniref:Outer membrane lipoprotein-sorting protein n=1 Tax=Frigoriglobus tundricola TaxID=2774151 RepID=A0A6M5Z4Z0_9BACT|nr:hypothetical protein [Frigoriglobus tundricola]QJX00572.1 hypothetical protein FTUN_8204 [Frigoriglobus tundricola]